jgi:hypothetical protein
MRIGRPNDATHVLTVSGIGGDDASGTHACAQMALSICPDVVPDLFVDLRSWAERVERS